jgi:hypothetical protein
MRGLTRRGLAGGLALLAISAAVPAATAAQVVPLAIKGYDPVAYFTLGRSERGRPQIAYDWDDHRYLFASAEHRAMFIADPVRYAPQFANFCAMALTRGELHEADPENWLISDGKLYIFGEAYGPDRFRADLQENIAKANQNRLLIPR